MRLEERRERGTDVGRRGLHRLELRGELIAQQRDQPALKGGPTVEPRGADFT